MSADTVITVDRLSKAYRLGQFDVGRNLRETIAQMPSWAAGRLRRTDSAGPDQSGPFWALRDVSFDVSQGEIVGIIGRNGAGKSTLLKLLARITDPTEGRAEIRGRVGSLLEVGSGFHPELTGRENIMLNGVVLGMTKAEIRRNFDPIVAFAEVEEFVDTPVKRYSSGMYLRLAFAVAAHLQTSILIVDEVLAVGDMAFQEKCLGKMREVGVSGRTVLFVSHNLGAVRTLCPRSILLSGGHLQEDGPTEDVLDTYLREHAPTGDSGIIPRDLPRVYGTDEAWIDQVKLVNVRGAPTSQLHLGEPFRISVTLEVVRNIREAVIEIAVTTLDGTYVTTSTSTDRGRPPTPLSPGVYDVELDVDVVLAPRHYSLLLGIHHYDGTTIEWVERAVEFSVLNLSADGSDSFRWMPPRGYVRPNGDWRVLKVR